MANVYPGISAKEVIGSFYMRLEEVLGAGWAGALSMMFESTQASETYKWLGMAPALREWIGGRQPKGFRENGLTIANKKWEATLAIEVDDLRRDKTGQLDIRIGELATRAGQHWEKLLSILIDEGASRVCYDGQFFYDTDHEEGDSGVQSNALTDSDYSELEVVNKDNPTANEFADALLKVIQHQYGYLDDQGEPMNGSAMSFLCMVPVGLWGAALVATTRQMLNTGSGTIDNVISQNNAFNVIPVPNPRLSWTDQFVVFRQDGGVSPLIRQEEEGVTVKVQGDGSPEEFHNDRHLYGLKMIGNVGYGYWQYATHATFSTATP